jgi:dihydrofolate reductase
MKINIIVSVSENLAIGKDNKLLWNLKSDLQRFKNLTSGHPIIMGQKTFESLPNGALPNRTNIVLTDNKKFTAKDIIPAYNIEESLQIAKFKNGTNCEVFIIGGGSIYKQFLELADTLYITEVHVNIDGDTFFPKISDEWELFSEEYKEKDERNEYDHTYKIYKKKK